LVSDAQHQDPCMATGWMEANVCQTSIQSDEESPCTPCRTYHVDIYGPSKPFISNGYPDKTAVACRHADELTQGRGALPGQPRRVALVVPGRCGLPGLPGLVAVA
jgi:hypothetical protein